MLEDARQWLAVREIAQWTRPFTDDWIEQKIAGGEFYVAYQFEEPVAVVRLLWEDALFWGEREQGDAAYVHTLVVHRNAAGRGLGVQMVEWAASRGRRCGRRFLRLDCGQANQALIAYYLGNGFQRVGQVEVGGEEMALLERKLET